MEQEINGLQKSFAELQIKLLHIEALSIRTLSDRKKLDLEKNEKTSIKHLPYTPIDDTGDKETFTNSAQAKSIALVVKNVDNRQNTVTGNQNNVYGDNAKVGLSKEETEKIFKEEFEKHTDKMLENTNVIREHITQAENKLKNSTDENSEKILEKLSDVADKTEAIKKSIDNTEGNSEEIVNKIEELLLEVRCLDETNPALTELKENTMKILNNQMNIITEITEKTEEKITDKPADAEVEKTNQDNAIVLTVEHDGTSKTSVDIGHIQDTSANDDSQHKKQRTTIEIEIPSEGKGFNLITNEKIQHLEERLTSVTKQRDELYKEKNSKSTEIFRLHQMLDKDEQVTKTKGAKSIKSNVPEIAISPAKLLRELDDIQKQRADLLDESKKKEEYFEMKYKEICATSELLWLNICKVEDTSQELQKKETKQMEMNIELINLQRLKSAADLKLNSIVECLKGMIGYREKHIDKEDRKDEDTIDAEAVCKAIESFVKECHLKEEERISLLEKQNKSLKSMQSELEKNNQLLTNKLKETRDDLDQSKRECSEYCKRYEFLISSSGHSLYKTHETSINLDDVSEKKKTTPQPFSDVRQRMAYQTFPNSPEIKTKTQDFSKTLRGGASSPRLLETSGGSTDQDTTKLNRTSAASNFESVNEQPSEPRIFEVEPVKSDDISQMKEIKQLPVNEIIQRMAHTTFPNSPKIRTTTQDFSQSFRGGSAIPRFFYNSGVKREEDGTKLNPASSASYVQSAKKQPSLDSRSDEEFMKSSNSGAGNVDKL